MIRFNVIYQSTNRMYCILVLYIFSISGGSFILIVNHKILIKK